MAINKNKAHKLFNTYHASMPANTSVEVDMLIECNAQLGHSNVEIFIAEPACDKIVASLRKRGFLVRRLQFASNDNWRLVDIDWTSSDFVQ